MIIATTVSLGSVQGNVQGSVHPVTTSLVPVKKKPKTRVFFQNRCTGEVVSLTSKKSSQLRIEIEGIEPREALLIDVTLSPAGEHASLNKKSEIKFKKKVQLGEEDHYSFTKKINFKKSFGPVLDSQRVWNAQVIWSQDRTSLGGAGSTEVTVVEERTDRYYQVYGPMICAWETPVVVDSNYFFNRDEDRMDLTRDLVVESGAVSVAGPDPQLWDNFISTGPIQRSPVFRGAANLYPWLFLYGQDSSAIQPTTLVSQRWTLSRGEGGFFGHRLTFERFQALGFRRENLGFCGDQWVFEQKGYLDVGKFTMEFDVVSPGRIYDLASIQAAMEEARPKINSCESQVSGEFNAQFRLPADRSGLMFFYPYVTEGGRRAEER